MVNSKHKGSEAGQGKGGLDEADRSSMEACCEGLDPVLKAVDELPGTGTSPPASAHNGVKQFLLEQLSSVSSAAASSSSSNRTGAAPPAGNLRPLRFRPKEVQNLQQLQAVLQKYAKSWPLQVKLPGNASLNEVATSAVQLVCSVTNQTARQQVIEKHSPAFMVLLDEGFRAGIILQSCAALRAALSIKVVTHVQLAQLLLVVRGVAERCLPSQADIMQLTAFAASSDQACCAFAWQHLSPLYTGTVSSGISRSSSPQLQLPAAQVRSLLVACYMVTSACLDPKLVPIVYEYVPVAIPVVTAAELFNHHVATGNLHGTARRGSASSVTQITVEDSSSAPDRTGTRFDSKAAVLGTSTTGCSRAAAGAGTGTGTGTGSSRSSSTQRAVPKGGGVAGGGSAAAGAASSRSNSAPSNGTQGRQSAAERAEALPSLKLPRSTAAPLDGCTLLTAYCRGFTPVLASAAEWMAGGGDSRPLGGSIKQFLTVRVAAGGGGAAEKGGSGRGGSIARYDRMHRTVVPRQPPRFLQNLQMLGQTLAGALECMWPQVPGLAAVGQMLTAVAKEVARELVIERNSGAYQLLLDAVYAAGVLITGCAALKQLMGITLSNEAQLREALIVCCDGIQCCLLSIKQGEEVSAASKRQAACAIFQRLRSITGSASAGDTDSSKDVGSSHSGSGKTAMPPCSLDVAWQVLTTFQESSVVMFECEGEVTSELLAEVEDLVLEDMGQPDPLTQLASFVKQMTPAQMGSILGPLRAGATAGPPKSEAGGDEGTWGKGQGLAGLKGLFQKPSGSKPIAVKASSSGVVVANTPRTPAGANTVSTKAAAAKAAAPAAAPQAQTAVAATIQTSTTGGAAAAGGVKGKKAATAPELLVEANLQEWYCSPEGLGKDVVQPLPGDSLALLTKLKLHTTHRAQGWNALHYACAGHRYELAKQLLKAGAPVDEPESQLGLQPLHLACLGRIRSAKQFKELIAAGEGLQAFKEFAVHCGPACLALVELLLQHHAEPSAQVEKVGSVLFGLTPLHLITCWQDAGCKDRIFGNPFVGKAAFMSKGDHLKVIALNSALLDLQQAQEGQLGARATSALDTQGLDHDSWQSRCSAKQYVDLQDNLDWDEDMERNLQHVRAVKVLLDHKADLEAEVRTTGETALCLAAEFGNAALTDLLLRAGADPEHYRWDGARALDIAADQGFPRVGWTLLCHGAQAVPMWDMDGKAAREASSKPFMPASNSLSPTMLVSNAVQCEDTPWNLRFLERLLLDGAPVDEVWRETGETPLLAAIGYGDVDMVRVLTMAGANVHATVGPRGITPIAQVVLKGAGHSSKEMLQVLLEAGADIHSWEDTETDYDLLQTAANAGDTEAVIRLVEAGANWKLPMGKRVVDGSVFYAPEILAIHVPNLRLSYMEGRLRLAEKTGRSKRAATAAALEPWLPPDINPDCKEATLRTCTAAGVTPSRPQLRPKRPQPATHAAGGRSWPSTARPSAADRAAAAAPLGHEQVVEQDDGDVDDLDALLAAIESVGGGGGSGGAGAGGGSGKASKKKKKETAAQREAKKQQQLRAAARLQKQQQQEDEEEDGEKEAQDSSSTSDAVAAAGADGNNHGSADARISAAPADTRSVAGEQQAAQVQQLQQDQEQDQQQQQEQPAAAPQQVLQQLQPQAQQMKGSPKEEPLKQKKGKKGKAGQQQQQEGEAKQHKTGGLQQAEPTLNGTNSSSNSAAQTQPQLPAIPSADSRPPTAAVTPAAAAAAAAAAPVRGGEAVTAVAAPAGIAAAAASPAVSAGTAGLPVQQTAARTFLPPHLRASMPAAAVAPPAVPAAVATPAVAPPAAAVVQQPVLQLAKEQQQQQQQTRHGPDRAAQMKQRMVQLAQEHQLQQQQQQQRQLQQQPLLQPVPQQQQQQQQQQAPVVKGPSPPLPALPHAMMALLSGTGQQAAPTPAAAAAAPGRSTGSKRQMPAAPAVRHGPTTLLLQQQQQQEEPHQQQQRLSPAGGVCTVSPRPADTQGDAAGSAGKAGKAPRLCVVCSQHRRNVLLIPCNHLVLCDGCAEQLHAQGKLSSCPQCSKPCKQRIRVHQS